MKLELWLETATKKLTQAGISSAQLDCLILLEDETGKDRGWLLAHPEHKLKSHKLENLNARLQRRAAHKPLAYIREKCEFYGRQFYIDKRVLQPRPESEAMIDQLKAQLTSKFRGDSWSVVDVGTGSGALAITAKLELPGLDVIATDIDAACLIVASKNVRQHEVKIDLYQADLLNFKLPDEVKIFAVLANLPYVPDNFKLNQAAANEPRQAIFGGPGGLELYRRLFAQLKVLKHRPLFVLCESLPPQHPELKKIASLNSYNLAATDVLVQVFKS